MYIYIYMYLFKQYYEIKIQIHNIIKEPQKFE